ncbi:type II toxin-antitoxin system RelE/ParE family toxin [Candidatus Saganbacteria bacterium]|nr:type II toxin-antitoxin system RelE/ParE family toxin [Candidatus Saganbacteria bacterium]
MLYNVLITKSAQKEIKYLPKSEIPGIITKIKSLAADPRPLGAKKLLGSANAYRIRKGDYRIVYSIEDKTREVVIYKVDHRKDVYR